MSAGRSVLSPRKPSSDEGEASAARVAASGIGGPGGSEAEPVSPFQLRPVFVAHTPSSSASSQSPSTHFSSVCVNDNHVILGTVAGNLLYYTKEEQLGTGGKKSTFSLKAVKQSAAGLKAQPANIIQPFISRTLAPPFAKPAAIAGAAGAASSGASAKLGADPVPPGQTKAVSWMAMISAKTFASLCESTLSFHTLPHLTPPKLMPYGQPVSTSLKAKLKSTAVDPTVDPRHLASCLRGVTCATSVTTDFYSGYSFVAAINQPASGVSSQLRQAVAQSGTSSWIAIGHPYGLVVLQLISDPAASGSDIAEDTVQFRIVAETALPFVPLSLAVSPPHIAKQSSYPQLVVCVSHASGFSTVSYKLGVGPGNAPLSTGIVQELFPSSPSPSVAPGFVPVVRHIPATETEMLVIPTPENAGIPVATDPGEFSLLAFSGNKLLAHTLHATSSISPSRTTVFFSLASASSGLSPLAVDSLILHGAPFSSVSTIWRDRIETVASISPQDLSSGTGETSWATQSLDPNMEEELQALNLRTSLAPQAPGPANAPGGSALSAGALVTIHYPGTAYRLALTSSGSVSRPLDDPFLLTQWGLFSIAPVTSPLQIANGLLRQAARHIATVIRGPAAGALPSVAEVLATTSDAVSLAHRFVIRELAVRASGAPGSGFQHDGRFLGSSASITTSMIGMNARDEALAMVRFIRLKAGYICLGAMALCQGRDSGGSQLEGPSAEGDAADTFGPFASASRASAEEVGVDARLVSDLQLCLSYCFSWFTKGCLDPRDLVRIFALGGLLPSSAVSREDPAGAPTDLTSSSTLQSGNGFSDMAELLESLRRTHGPVARDYAHKQSHILLARVLIYFRRGHPAITPPIFPAFRAEVDTALLACLSRLDASHAAFLLLTGGAPDEGPPPASIGRGIADPSAPLLMQLAPLVPAGMHAVDLIPRPAAVWWQAHCSAGSDLPLMTPGHARSPCDEALVQMFRSSQCFTSPVGRAFTPLYSGSIDRPMFDTLAAAGHARWFLLAQKARGQLADAIHLSLHLLLRRATVDATRATVALRSELGDLGQTPDLEAWLAAAPSALSDPGPGADGTAAPLPGAELSLKELSAWVPFLALAAPQPAMPAALRASLASGQPPGPGSGRPGSEPLSANGSPSGDLIDGLARLGMSPTGGRANPHLAHIHANWQAASARARQAAWQGFTRATLAAFVLGLTATEGGLEGGTASAVKPANLGTFVAHVESALAAMVASMHVALLGDHGLPAGASTVASPGASGPGGTGPAVPGLASRHWRAAVVGATLAAGRGLVSLVHQHLQRLGPGSSPAAGPAAGAGRLVTPADLGDWLDETYLWFLELLNRHSARVPENIKRQIHNDLARLYTFSALAVMTSQRPGACRPLTVSSLARTPQDLEAQWDSFAEAELGGTLETEASLLRLACRSPDSAHIWPVIPGPGPDAHGNGPRPGSGSNVRSFLRLLLTIAAGTSEGMGLDTAHALRAEAAAAPDAAATTTTTTTTGAFISDQELAGQSLHFEQFLSQVVLQLAHLGGSGTAGDGAQSPSDPAGGSASPPAGAANGGGPPLMMDLLSRRRLRLAFFLRSGQCPLDLTPQHLTAGRPFPWQPAAFDAGDLWDAFYPIAGRLATVHAPGPEDALWQRLLALHPLLGPGVPGPSPGQDPASAASSPGPLPTHASICFRWELALLAIQSQQLLVASRILLASATSVPLSASRRRDCLALLRFLALARGPAPGSGTAAPDVATSAAAASASSSALQLPLAVAVPHSGAGDTSQLVTISSCWILAVVNALAPQMDSKPGSTELLRDLFLHSSLSGTSLCPSTAGIIIGVLSHYSIQFMGPGEPEPNSDDPDHVAKAGLSLAFTNYLQRCLAELSSSARSARLTRNLSRAHLQNLSLRHKAERATRGVVIHEESTCCLCGKQLIQEPSGLSAAAAASHDAHSGGFVMIPLFSTASDYDLAGDLSPRDGQAMAVYLAQGMSASFARPPPAGVERLPPEPTGVGTAHVQCANLAGLF